MVTGLVKGSEIKKNRDADKKSLLLQVQITNPDDIQTIEAFLGSGEDFNPPDNSRIVYIAAGNAFKIAVAIDDGVEPAEDLEKGERELYSTDNGGGRKATHRLKKDSTHVFNGGEDYAVRFSELETAFNKFKDDFNKFANQYVPGGPTAVGLPPKVIPSTADIAPAKVEEILIP